MATQPKIRSRRELGVFNDSEVWFYAQGVRDFFIANREIIDVVELGTGTGEAMCDVLASADIPSTLNIHGYEIHPESADMAVRLIQQSGLAHVFRVSRKDFFADASTTDATCAISNPPYLPSLESPTIMPELWGGKDGSDVTKQIFGYNFKQILLMLSSYSDPVCTLRHAREKGYKVSHYQVKRTEFGIYSNEPIVQRRIWELVTEDRAYVKDATYNLAGVTWVKDFDGPDMSDSLSAQLRSF